PARADVLGEAGDVPELATGETVGTGVRDQETAVHVRREVNLAEQSSRSRSGLQFDLQITAHEPAFERVGASGGLTGGTSQFAAVDLPVFVDVSPDDRALGRVGTGRETSAVVERRAECNLRALARFGHCADVHDIVFGVVRIAAAELVAIAGR